MDTEKQRHVSDMNGIETAECEQNMHKMGCCQLAGISTCGLVEK